MIISTSALTYNYENYSKYHVHFMQIINLIDNQILVTGNTA